MEIEGCANALNRRLLMSGMLLAVAIVAFTSLGYAPVTVLQTTTMIRWSWYPYIQTLSHNCCFTVYVTLPQPTSILIPFATNYTLTPAPYTVTSSVSSLRTYTITQISSIPASEALGLSPRALILLAVTVIGLLALVTAWLILKSRITASH